MGSNRRSGRLIGGLIVIVAGVLLLLSSLDVIEFDIGEIVGWVASILLMVLGIGILVTRRFKSVILPIVLIGVGIIILLSNIGVDVSDYWPVILILIGAGIILGGIRHQRQSRSSKIDVSIGESYSTTTDGQLDISCTLGEAKERVEAKDFTGGAVNVTMGNVNLDLRSAEVENPPAKLDASLTMGGLHMRVPSEWAVQIDINSTMGEAEDKRPQNENRSSQPELIISGQITMGSLVIED